jgi:hypothetical protein
MDLSVMTRWKYVQHPDVMLDYVRPSVSISFCFHVSTAACICILLPHPTNNYSELNQNKTMMLHHSSSYCLLFAPSKVPTNNGSGLPEAYHVSPNPTSG